MVLSTNVLFGVQSVYKKEKGLTGMYYDYAMAAPFMAGVEEKMVAGEDFSLLVLGMGTGTYGSQCARYYPGMRVEGVEIDGKITDLAHRYFSLPDDMTVTTYDGRAFLNAVKDRYDVIMVDAYQDITIPFQMSSVEFFTQVRDHLKEDGVMVVNMNMRGEREGNINQYLSDTISAVFSDVWTVDVLFNTNRELFAANHPEALSVMERNAARCADAELQEMIALVSRGLARYEAGGYLMTDDRAPVELLGMQVVDELIREEVSGYKQIYEKDGIRGIIGSL